MNEWVTEVFVEQYLALPGSAKYVPNMITPQRLWVYLLIPVILSFLKMYYTLGQDFKEVFKKKCWNQKKKKIQLPHFMEA